MHSNESAIIINRFNYFISSHFRVWSQTVSDCTQQPANEYNEYFMPPLKQNKLIVVTEIDSIN